MPNLSCEMSFISTRIKNCFGINGFALCLAFKQRFEVTWKWPIVFRIHITHSFWFYSAAIVLYPYNNTFANGGEELL